MPDRSTRVFMNEKNDRMRNFIEELGEEIQFHFLEIILYHSSSMFDHMMSDFEA